VAEDHEMSEHETDLLEQTTRKLAWIARGMVALIGMGFAAGVWYGDSAGGDRDRPATRRR
jgi:hypothetical protein